MSARLQLRRVLLTEDNPADALLITEAFRDCGSKCELVYAASHDDAKRQLANGDFDMVLSDFGTNYRDAEAFLRFVRNTAPCLPIVVLSNIVDPTPAYLCGVNAFVRKSMDIADFFEKIRVLIHFWTEVAELPQAGQVSH